jgi:predicted ATPase
MYLRSAQLILTRDEDDLEEYPFSLPVIQSLHHKELEFDSPVTIFVGENGTGKSTLLEGLAVACESIAVGGYDVHSDPTLYGARRLAEKMKLVWNLRTRRGFFMRTEDFFNFSRRLAELKDDMEDNIESVDAQYEGRSDYAKALAKGSYRKSINAIEQTYRGDLEERSHGESLLTLFQARFVPGGLYLLDEPESALSPISQLALLSMVKEMVTKNCQFVIATHSPIIMAVPGASILSFDSIPICKKDYDDLDHVRLFRDFMQDPDRFLRHL